MIVRLWIVIVCVAIALTCSCGTYSYDEAVQLFKGRETRVCSETSFMNYLRKIRNGSGILAMVDASDSLKLVAFEVENGKLSIMRELSCDRNERISLNRFTAMCDSSVALLYMNKVYWNISRLSCELKIGKSVADMLSQDGLRVKKELAFLDPKTKFRCSVLSKEFGSVSIGEFSIQEPIDEKTIVECVCENLEEQLYKKWKKEHDSLAKKLPRRAPVVYGNVKDVVRNSNGTYTIPRDPPPTERTITWTETIYADAHGFGTTDSGEGVDVNFRVPVGERTRSRTKKISGAMQYAELKRRLEEYEALREKIENDRPPVINKTKVARIIKYGGCKMKVAICK